MATQTPATATPVAADPERLKVFAASVLRGCKMEDQDAKDVAEVLVRTDMRGVRTHGVRTLPGYVEQIEGGGMNPHANVHVVRESGSVAVVDGDAGPGQLVAVRATQIAISKAKKTGQSTVTVRNSNHLGACGHYALMAAEAGLISLVLSNAPPVMKVPGSRTAVLGNGPLAYGAPFPAGAPLVFDAAMSVVAGTKVIMARERGQKIPDGWLVSPEGLPTTDPEDFFRGGALVPLGGHKGYSLTLLGELLAGVLSGAAMATAIGAWRFDKTKPTNTGHVFIALDIEAFMSFAEYTERIELLCDTIKSAPKESPDARIMVPGEIERDNEQAAGRDGIYFDNIVWESLQHLAERFGEEAALQASARGNKEAL
jgi:LDH2 family malate/lactate/ureidoglycolate dehydrogenase